MSAIIEACNVQDDVMNTGKECDTAMGAPAMFIMVPPSFRCSKADLADPVNFFTGLMHAAKSLRAYFFFGENSPITAVTNNQDQDVLVTLDNGLQVFLRYGIYNRIFETISGGLCYAAQLTSFNKSRYRVIEIDQTGQLMLHKYGPDSYGGMIPSFMYSPAPILADFKNTPYKNRFQLSGTVTELVNFGKIFAGGGQLLSLMGLIDTDITEAAAGSTTKLKISVKTECAGSDLIALYPTEIADLTNFLVTNVATGVVITPTAIAIVNGILEITGTFVSGQTYNVVGTAPSVWLSNDIEGYDAQTTGGANILIP